MIDNPLNLEVFKLKGRLFTLTVLELYQESLTEFDKALKTTYDKAPKMFNHTPIVLDLKPLKGASFDLKGFCEAMRAYKMVPIAVQNASVIQNKAAVACGLSVIGSTSQKSVIENVVAEKAIAPKEPEVEVKSEAPTNLQQESAQTAGEDDGLIPPSNSLVVTQPVRSGQQLYAKDGDLIVLASVGRGAELLADGHIHVYGTLRGRALAGLNGDTSARIFCSKMDAELIAIAGHYLMPEQEGRLSHQTAKQIILRDEHLTIIDL